jgi:heme A synthase
VALAFLLAVLGRATGSSLAPGVALANVLGGMAMLALFAYLTLDARTTPVRPVAVAAIVLLCLQIALGVLTSAQLAGRACAELFSCAAVAQASAADLVAFNPFHALAPSDGAARALLQLAHRAVGALTAAALLALAAQAARSNRADRVSALALGALVVAELALGTLLVVSDLPLGAATAHSAFAALLVATTVRAALGSKSREAALAAISSSRVA